MEAVAHFAVRPLRCRFRPAGASFHDLRAETGGRKMSVSIDIDNVTKRFGSDTVIRGLSLHIRQGEFFTLLGPSGCGKTTLLRMIIGFNAIDGGQIKVNGEIVNHIPIHQRNMGMVFQNYAIFPHMTVRDNVAFGLKMRRTAPDEIERRVDEILKVVKIDHLKDRMPAKLSGGQQQRVALARAIVIRPAVLLMDEPLSNLDAKLRVEMRNAIRQIQRQIGITTVYVTHDQEEALAISDRIAIMESGVIQQIATPEEVYRRPANTFVSTFIGLSNLFEAELTRGESGDTLAFPGGYRAAARSLCNEARGGKVLVSVRPEEFDIRRGGEEGIAAVIESRMFLGLTTHYFVRLENGQAAEVIQDRNDTELLAEQTPIRLTVNEKKINVFDSQSRTSLIGR